MKNFDLFFVSPVDGSVLKQDDDRLIDANGNSFCIINNIPRFVDADNYSESFGFQWNIFNQTQVDVHNRTSISEQRFYQSTRWKDDELKGQKILEVGSGSGRFTQIVLKTGAEVYSFDYSNNENVVSLTD